MKSYMLVGEGGLQRLGPNRDDVAALREPGDTLYGVRADFALLFDLQKDLTWGVARDSDRRKKALSRLKLSAQEIWLED